jgi:hypothetical protein
LCVAEWDSATWVHVGSRRSVGVVVLLLVWSSVQIVESVLVVVEPVIVLVATGFVSFDFLLHLFHPLLSRLQLTGEIRELCQHRKQVGLKLLDALLRRKNFKR